MKHTIYFYIRKGESHFYAECIDLPIVTQGLTLDELAHNIQEAVELHLDGEDMEELGFVSNPSIMANIELNMPVY